jgi:hypothetical protein
VAHLSPPGDRHLFIVATAVAVVASLLAHLL